MGEFDMKVDCPDCFFSFDLEEGVMKGEVITCADCGAQLEVVELKPKIKLQVAEVEEEDWGE